jgi:hypothetical protein
VNWITNCRNASPSRQAFGSDTAKTTTHYYEDKIPNVEYVYTVGKRPTFKVGDNVRISVEKGKFDKGHNLNWSKENFIIITVDKSHNLIMYQLEGLTGEAIEGKFYSEELQKTKS